MHRFSFYLRNGIYYARFYNPQTKKYSSGKSTGEREKMSALAKVALWDKYGFNGSEQDDNVTVADFIRANTVKSFVRTADLTKEDAAEIVNILRKRQLVSDLRAQKIDETSYSLLSFLSLFWDYEKSPYVQSKKGKKGEVGRRHCYEQSSRLKHWREFFPEILKEKYPEDERPQVADIHIADIDTMMLEEFQIYLAKKSLAP